MITPALFFGFPIDHTLEAKLNDANPHRVDMFINNKSDYLHRLEDSSTIYLGKFIGESTDLKALKLLEANIKSLLQMIIPGETLQAPLFLMTSVSTGEM